jgi:hypothetical protein
MQWLSGCQCNKLCRTMYLHVTEPRHLNRRLVISWDRIRTFLERQQQHRWPGVLDDRGYTCVEFAHLSANGSRAYTSSCPATIPRRISSMANCKHATCFQPILSHMLYRIPPTNKIYKSPRDPPTAWRIACHVGEMYLSPVDLSFRTLHPSSNRDSGIWDSPLGGIILLLPLTRAFLVYRVVGMLVLVLEEDPDQVRSTCRNINERTTWKNL